MADDKLQRLRNLMWAAKTVLDELADADELIGNDCEMFIDVAILIIALHEMGCPEYAPDKELVEMAYNLAKDHEWFDGSGFPADNPFEEKSQ